MECKEDVMSVIDYHIVVNFDEIVNEWLKESNRLKGVSKYGVLQILEI